MSTFDLLIISRNHGDGSCEHSIARYFKDTKKHTLTIYREEFFPGRYAFTDNFREVEDKVDLVALPAAIYDAYQKELPKRREKLFEEESGTVNPLQQTKIPANLFEGQGI